MPTFSWKQQQIISSVILVSSIFNPASCFNYICSSTIIPSNNKKTCQMMTMMSSSDTDNNNKQINLSSYLESNHNVNSDLSQLIHSVANACDSISKRLSRHPIEKTLPSNPDRKTITRSLNIHGEEQKAMDVIANEIFIENVKGHVSSMLSEENNDYFDGEKVDIDGGYEIAFDPLDGSSNLDVSIPTGTIFGVSPNNPKTPFSSSGRSLVAAGYALYSSSTEFVLSLGQSGPSSSQNRSIAVFTLDPYLDSTKYSSAERFILTKSNINCPYHGLYYSLNDAREPDWPEGLRRYINDAKCGKTPCQTIFSARYVCSLVADVHRTLLKGGWAGNPRPHLRLLYEAAPLAYIAEAAGGKGSDGVQNLLDVVPKNFHQRIPVFIGSVGDINELEMYGDVQQIATSYKA